MVRSSNSAPNTPRTQGGWGTMTHLPPLWLAFAFNELEQPEEVVEMVKYLDMSHLSGSVSKPCTPVVHIKIAGKWMFIPLKMVLIGIDPTPYLDMSHLSLSKRQMVIEKTKAVVKEGIFHGEYSINDMRRFYDFKSRSSCHLCTGLSVGKRFPVQE